MAEAALRLLADPELARCVTGNALKECARYGADRVAAEWVALYQELSSAKTA